MNTFPLQAELKKHSIPPVDEALLKHGVLGYFPWVRISNRWLRGVAFGLSSAALAGAPLIAALAFLEDPAVGLPGLTYCWVKAVFSACVAAAVFPAMFVSAISTDKLTPGSALAEAVKKN